MLMSALKNRKLQNFRNAIKPFFYKAQNLLAYKNMLNRKSGQPDFLIIGAQKCGTTSLYDQLVKFGAIEKSLRKEVHFFDKNYQNGLGWYFGFFKEGKNKLITEATPSYLFCKEVPRRVYKDLGSDIKLVIILRDPVERAISHFFHDARMGYEKRSIENAFDKCFQGASWHYLKFEGADGLRGNYLERGLYFQQIAYWSKVFSRENMHICFMEELNTDAEKFFLEISEFLEKEIVYEENDSVSNKGIYKQAVPESLISSLTAFYAKDVTCLETFLGRKVPWERFGALGND